MKKRYIISLVLTTVLLIITNPFWFILKPLQLSFDISIGGGGRLAPKIRVELDGKNAEFKHTKNASTIIEPSDSKEQKVKLQFKRVKKVKAVKIILNNLETGSFYSISPLTFRKKYKLDDLDKYNSDDIKLIPKNGKITFIPDKNKIEIIYSGDIPPIRSSIKLDFCLFVIILVLGYLLSLKITGYLADFKINKNASRLDIIFLLIFFTMLILPLSHINNAEISQKENRNLAKFKPLINSDKTFNYNFANDFSAWFDDRFNFRNELVSISYISLRLTKYWETERVVKGKEDWLFYKGDKSIKEYQNINSFSEDELKKIADYLSSIDRWCKKRNKKFYFIVAPNKNRIYGEFFPEKYKKIRPDNEARMFVLADYLRKNTDVKVILPYYELMKNKDKLLYHKTGTHWNKYGAYIGYETLYKEISKDFKIKKAEIIYNPDVKIEHSGGLRGMLSDYYRIPFEYEPQIVIKEKNDKCKPQSIHQDPLICYNNKGRYNLVMFRDSFTISMAPYISQAFKNSEFYWQYAAEKDKMKNADIVILEVVERYLYQLAGFVGIGE